MLKFMYNGIKLNGELFKAWYSKGNYTTQSGIPEGTITIYAKGYSDLPNIQGLQIENNTDSMSDYFEKDKIRVTPDNKFYAQVLTAFNAQEAHRQKAYNKRMGITETVEPVKVQEVKIEMVEKVAVTENNTNTIEIEVSYNTEKNGIELKFNGKPSEEVRTQLKSNGFRWSKPQLMWYAKDTEERREFVNSLLPSKNIELETIETIAEVEVIEESEDKMPDAKDFNNINTLKEKYITNWSVLPIEIQNFILSCDKYWICLQAVELYKGNKIVASIGCSRWEDTIEVTSIGAGELFQWELYKGFTLNNLTVENNINDVEVSFENVEIIETLDRNIFVNCLIPSLNKNCRKELNDIEIKESSYVGLFQVQKIVKLNLEQYNYFINNLLHDYDFLTGLGGWEQDDNKKLLHYYGVAVVCDNMETLIIDPSGMSYARYLCEIVSDENNSLQAELSTLNTTIIINNELYTEAINSIINTELYEISVNNKTIINDNRYIKNIPCNGLTVVTGKTIKELMAESKGIDILNLKILRLYDNVFREGLLKHDSRKVFSLFPSAEDKELENIKFMDRLNNELKRAIA